MREAIRFDTYIESEDVLDPITVSISAPIPSDEMEEEYFCRVHAPALIGRGRNIFGIDGSQAQDLAVQFVKSLLGGKRLVDKNRNPISW
jgi:hypothetical protein